MDARSIAFSSSRILPGQAYAIKQRMASGSMRRFIRSAPLEQVRMKCSTSSGISSTRSLNGGNCKQNTLSLKYRSSRNIPAFTSACRSRDVADTTRTSTFRELLAPTRRISSSCNTRKSFTCKAGGISPISSRKSVPPSASSKSPVLSSEASVNDPRTWPNNSLSKRFSGMAPQFTATKDL